MRYSLIKFNNIVNVIFVVLTIGCLQSCHNSKPTSPEALKAFESIMPKPVSARTTGKTFFLNKDVSIAIIPTADEQKAVAKYLQEKLKDIGFDVPMKEDTAAYGVIYLTTTIPNRVDWGNEGYELSITERRINISANSPQGLFHGIQSLLQMLPPVKQASDNWEIATGIITDQPSYAWRGSMLDVARHFFSVEDVKRYIDLIAQYKMNIMHLHLSDDQGWRIEIKSWPNLTTIGGSTEVGGGKGGFYTQEQYADIVAYAQRQYVTVVPEIDLPGHINAALASYAELNAGILLNLEGLKSNLAAPAGDLNAKPQPRKLYTGTEVGFSTLQIKKEVTFKFVDDVLRELAAITPGPYLHIGGDEATATKKKDYITFINRFKDMVKARGKQMIGWEEIAQANIDANAIAQHWHAAEYAKMAEEKGAKLILSPATRTYLDMQYNSTTKLGLHWAAYIEVNEAYNWDPSTQLQGVANESILGVEAPLWTETIQNMDDIEFMIFPRMPAIAEVGWTPKANRSWNDFKARLVEQSKRWKASNIDFYRSPLISWQE